MILKQEKSFENSFYVPSFYRKLLKTIETLPTNKNVNFITIWGGSCTGKTTLCHYLNTNLPNLEVFSIDNYLNKDLLTTTFNHTPPTEDNPYIEGLDPSLWDLDSMNDDLKRLASGKSIDMPLYNYSIKRRIGHKRINPSRIILVEGAYAMETAVPQNVIMSIILEASLHSRLIRKLVRTTRINNRTDIDESIKRYLTQTEPSLNYYTNHYSPTVDAIFNTNLHPEQEFIHLTPITPLTEGSRQSLVPKKSTGKQMKAETLRFSKETNTLTYIVKEKVIFSVSLNHESISLILSHYDTIALLDKTIHKNQT